MVLNLLKSTFSGKNKFLSERVRLRTNPNSLKLYACMTEIAQTAYCRPNSNFRVNDRIPFFTRILLLYNLVLLHYQIAIISDHLSTVLFLPK